MLSYTPCHVRCTKQIGPIDKNHNPPTAPVVMSMPRADVLIVGAGPSGSTAATTLARLGHSVAIIDKATLPRHKTCASWINALVFSRFPYLQPELHNLADCPFYGIRFYDQAI